MLQMLKVAFVLGVGYYAVKKLAPYVQAKIESMDLDQMWEVWNDVD